MCLQKINTMYFRLFFKALVFFLFVFCSRKETSKVEQQNIKSIYTPKYAKHFKIFREKHALKIAITENLKDTMFLMVEKPFEKLAVMGTIPMYQLFLLNDLDKVVAIDDIKYYNLKKVHELFQSNKISELMPNLQWNYEMLLMKKPDLLITYSNIDRNGKLYELTEKNNIQHLIYLDYLESHPLGRAEWIRVLGCLTGKDSLSEKIFSDIERKYKELTRITDTVQHRPSVFTEVMYGDVWYIAGKYSYIAQMIKDAGGKYVFDFHEYENSKPYSFEYVLKYAKDADFWIHTHQFETLQGLKNNNSKYALFTAFQKKHCFNNNKVKNKYGFNDYYESGICLPHLILEDLIRILHPAYLPKDSLHYYYQLSE